MSIPLKYQVDPMYKEGMLHYTKLKNSRVIINLPDLSSGNDKVLFKFIRYSKDIKDYDVDEGILLGNCKRGVVTTYLVLSREAYAFMTQIGLQTIAENFDFYYKLGYGAKC